MANVSVEYADAGVAQRVSVWAKTSGINAEEQLLLHLGEKFGIQEMNILKAQEDGDSLLILVATKQWNSPREFALLSNGSFVW